LSYRHAAFLSQISPEKDRVAWCIKRLRDTGILDRTPTDIDQARIARRLAQSRAWVEKYATENRVKLLDEVAPDVLAQLESRDRDALRVFAGRVASVRWTEDAIKESMVSLTKGGSLPVDTSRFFRDLYLVLLGSERGPRAAPFLAVLEKEWVLGRLKEAAQ
jgi:lysyl-tRNA synthetase class 1